MGSCSQPTVDQDKGPVVEKGAEQGVGKSGLKLVRR